MEKESLRGRASEEVEEVRECASAVVKEMGEVQEVKI